MVEALVVLKGGRERAFGSGKGAAGRVGCCGGEGDGAGSLAEYIGLSDPHTLLYQISLSLRMIEV